MRYSGFMIDMDGTVYKGGDLIPGATDFIAALKAKGIPFVFLTNNSSHSRDYYYNKLVRMGFDVSIDNVLTSNIATIRFVLSERPGKRVYVVGAPDVIEEVRSAGINVVEEDPDIVYLTFDRTIDYDKINKAYKALCKGAELIATHPDDVCPTETDYDIDIGPFIRLFEQMCQTTAVVIGKPSRLMLEMAAREMGVDPKGTVMVGDRLYTDIRMGNLAGIATILVLSGETSRGDLEGSDVVPTHVLDSVADIPSLLE
ncbi:MAG: HAD-IIA family hydrolase [Thermoplasmata archaeon]|nr:HAD-IIA family hydrolase [Thermoplasmata archaeon]MBR6213798.1 HAD-IIA family hydrolase [Candidatus Methanomethylophilaceae archaeon]